MPSIFKPIRLIACGMLFICGFLFFPESAFSRDKNKTTRTLQVGIMVYPPLYMKTADNRWEGFSVELWNAVAEQLGVPFEFQEFSSLPLMLDALEKRKIDVIPVLAVKEGFESTVEFSQSYMKSGLAIAVPAEDAEYRWIRIFQGVFSKTILKAIVAMILMALIAGILVWSFERQRNSEMFGERAITGSGNGMWWAMVTMATVGYGDKAPKTIGGRIVALIWIIFSLIFIASFTANITASLTISELKGKVRGFNDLYNVRVGAIHRSEGFDFLTKQGISVIPIENNQKGLLAVASKEIDAFVQDENILKYQVKTKFPGQVYVLPGTFDDYFVGIALQQNSPLRKSVNKALLKIMRTQKWTELLNRYFL
jgi:ABC-type amino acid transport substrate-binding protein